MAKNQHIHHTITTDELKELFGVSIMGIGRVVCVFMPWDSPDYLGRIWCLFELVTAVSCGVEWAISLPSSQVAAFHNTMITDFDKIAMVLSKVDVSKATAREDSDRAAIMQVVEEGVGVYEMNKRVIGALSKWITDSAHEAIEWLTDDQINSIAGARFLNGVARVLLSQVYHPRGQR